MKKLLFFKLSNNKMFVKKLIFIYFYSLIFSIENYKLRLTFTKTFSFEISKLKKKKLCGREFK